MVDELLTSDNTAGSVWADSAYRSKEIEEKVKERDLTSRMHRKGYRIRRLRDWEKAGKQNRSWCRARVGQVFGAQGNGMGGTPDQVRGRLLVRSIGLVRARARVGLKNLAYTMRRLVPLQRLAAVDSRERVQPGMCRILSLKVPWLLSRRDITA